MRFEWPAAGVLAGSRIEPGAEREGPFEMLDLFADRRLTDAALFPDRGAAALFHDPDEQLHGAEPVHTRLLFLYGMGSICGAGSSCSTFEGVRRACIRLVRCDPFASFSFWPRAFLLGIRVIPQNTNPVAQPEHLLASS